MKGILISGRPGTGKTLLVQALAHESGINFINVQAAKVLSRYLGESERALKDIFRVAKQAAPSIIYFDEIEALFPDRRAGTSSMYGATESRMTAQFMSEMRGIEELTGVTVLATTSRPEKLDEGILASGIFELRIELPMPDEAERAEIFRIKLRKKPLAEDVDIAELARLTANMTGGEIALKCRRAEMRALKADVKNFELRMEYFDD